jgi:hypothetical protein
MARANTKPSAGATVLEFDQDAIKRTQEAVAKETDEQILERLGLRFQILHDMTLAVKTGDVRAMIVSGPPGVGKSFGVEAVLQKADLFNTLAEKKPKFEVVKGAMSSIGLYAKLYEFSGEGNVVVFDDCDDILMEEQSLNTLKGALDSSERRFISWNTDSRILRSEGIPDRFEFKGAAIFITNIKFEHVRSRSFADTWMPWKAVATTLTYKWTPTARSYSVSVKWSMRTRCWPATSLKMRSKTSSSSMWNAPGQASRAEPAYGTQAGRSA